MPNMIMNRADTKLISNIIPRYILSMLNFELLPMAVMKILKRLINWLIFSTKRAQAGA